MAIVWWSAGRSPRSRRINVTNGEPSGRTCTSLGMKPKVLVYHSHVFWYSATSSTIWPSLMISEGLAGGRCVALTRFGAPVHNLNKKAGRIGEAGASASPRIPAGLYRRSSGKLRDLDQVSLAGKTQPKADKLRFRCAMHPVAVRIRTSAAQVEGVVGFQRSDKAEIRKEALRQLEIGPLKDQMRKTAGSDRRVGTTRRLRRFQHWLHDRSYALPLSGVRWRLSKRPLSTLVVYFHSPSQRRKLGSCDSLCLPGRHAQCPQQQLCAIGAGFAPASVPLQ